MWALDFKGRYDDHDHNDDHDHDDHDDHDDELVIGAPSIRPD